MQNTEEIEFLTHIKNILYNGNVRPDRTGIGTRSLFNVNMQFDLQKKFPLITTRRLSLRMIFEELMWFLRGQTDVGILNKKKVPIWNPNSTRAFLDEQGLGHLEEGDVGKSYGFQFRHSGAEYVDCKTDYTGQGFDQLQYVIDLLRNDPFSRRIIINLWNPSDLDKTALPPCGFCYQFYVHEEGDTKYLSCKAIQRSSDISLAGGWNIASASLLTYMLAHVVGMVPSTLYWTIGDCHVYGNQIEGVKTQLRRKPNPFPTLQIIKTPRDNEITNFEFDHFMLEDYAPHPRIALAMNP